MGIQKKKKKRTELGARLALPAGEDRRRRRELGARLALPAGEERRRRPRRRSRRE